jgi:hypothetical protein
VANETGSFQLCDCLILGCVCFHASYSVQFSSVQFSSVQFSSVQFSSGLEDVGTLRLVIVPTSSSRHDPSETVMVQYGRMVHRSVNSDISSLVNRFCAVMSRACSSLVDGVFRMRRFRLPLLKTLYIEYLIVVSDDALWYSLLVV